MSTKPRSEIIQPGDSVALRAQFLGSDGAPADLDQYPSVTVVQPSGGVSIGPTSVGVSRIGIGQYEFDYNISLQPALGTWRDIWQGMIQGFAVYGEFTFTVYTSQVPGINTDGLAKLGDDPGYNFSQVAIHNINNILKSVNARLKNKAKKPSKDQYGNDIYVDCDVFSTDELVAFIGRSLASINTIPMFTTFTFEDCPIIEFLHDLIVQGAVIYALGAQAIIERGREFQLTDNGASFTPPSVADMLNAQCNTELTNWTERTRQIKANMRAAPLGLGSLTITATSPAMRRLRLLRERQIW